MNDEEYRIVDDEEEYRIIEDTPKYVVVKMTFNGKGAVEYLRKALELDDEQ